MIKRNNSKILLRAIACISILSGINVTCGESNWDKVMQAMNICALKVSDMTSAGLEKIKEINPVHAFFTTTGIASVAIGAQVGGNLMNTLACKMKAPEEVNTINAAMAIGGIIGGLIGGSFMRGIYNVRADNTILKNIEARYTLKPVYNWSQLPANYATHIICAGSDVQVQEKLSCLDFINQKIIKMTDDTIFDFTLFTNKLPHTSIDGFYCVAKNYFNDFECFTVGDLRELIDNSLVIVEEDFQQLKKITNLDKQMKIPVSLQDFNSMKMLLHQSQQQVVMNSCLGAFGYSPLHNSQQAKDFIVHVVKIHAFLNNLKELFATCADGSDILVYNNVGHLNFTLQHINYVQNVQIR